MRIDEKSINFPPMFIWYRNHCSFCKLITNEISPLMDVRSHCRMPTADQVLYSSPSVGKKTWSFVGIRDDGPLNAVLVDSVA